MNKLNRLKDVAIRQDKRGFINAIYDFTEEDIIRLTEQEFDDAQEYCTKIKLDGVDEFFAFLYEELLQHVADGTEYNKEELLIIRFYLTIILITQSEYDEYSSSIAINLGNVHQELAELGINAEKNIRKSIELCKYTREIEPEKSKKCMVATTNMGVSYVRLADIGIEPEKILINQ